MNTSDRHVHSHASGCSDHGYTVEFLINKLRGTGLRMTKARQQVLEILVHANSPLNLDEIKTRVSEAGVKPDFSTIFRIMQLLEKMQLAQRVHLGRTSAYYELSSPNGHHDHITCTNCGIVAPLLDACPVANYQQRLAASTGFKDVTHSLEFFGLCPSCSQISER